MNESFQRIFAAAALGSIIAFSDGTPRPPDRFKRKLSDWQNRNGAGRLVGKEAKSRPEEWNCDTIKLHLGDHGGGGVIVLRTYMNFGSNSALTFALESVIPAGRFVLLTHSVHVGTEFQGHFATLEEARDRQHNGHRYSACGIYSVGEAGALELAEGVDGPTREPCPA